MSAWVVETCSCGFGGGDAEHEFDTRDEVTEYVHWNGLHSDASIIGITSPTGGSWRSSRLMESIVVPEA